MRPTQSPLFWSCVLRQKDLKEIPLIQQQHLMRSRGQWRCPFSGQGSGPSTNTQSELLSFCLFPALISVTSFFFYCYSKSFKTDVLVQSTHFIDEETEAQNSCMVFPRGRQRSPAPQTSWFSRPHPVIDEDMSK